MPFVETKTVINGNIDDIYNIVKNMEAYPSFMNDLESVKILEKGSDYTLSHWVSNVDGRRIVWTEKDNFFDAEKRITYKEWRLTNSNEGVEVLLSVDFEFGIPMIAGLLNPILKRKVRENSENMLAAVKAKIENNTK